MPRSPSHRVLARRAAPPARRKVRPSPQRLRARWPVRQDRSPVRTRNSASGQAPGCRPRPQRRSRPRWPLEQPVVRSPACRRSRLGHPLRLRRRFHPLWQPGDRQPTDESRRERPAGPRRPRCRRPWLGPVVPCPRRLRITKPRRRRSRANHRPPLRQVLDHLLPTGCRSSARHRPASERRDRGLDSLRQRILRCWARARVRRQTLGASRRAVLRPKP